MMNKNSEDQCEFDQFIDSNLTDITKPIQVFTKTLQFWVVSASLALELKSRGENIQYILGMQVWIRSITDQITSVNSVLYDIYNEDEKNETN